MGPIDLGGAETGTSGGTGTGTGGGTPARVMFQGGYQFGECAGACRFELTFGTQSAELVVEDWTDPNPVLLNGASYTDAGRAWVDQVESSLAGASLLDLYGCPDCADGGASWVALHQADLTTTHMYEFGNPPAELAEYDTLMTELVQVLRSCEATANFEPDDACEPLMP